MKRTKQENIRAQLLYELQDLRRGIAEPVKSEPAMKQIEDALRASEKFSSSLANNSPNPILFVNADTSIGYVNPALEKITGCSSRDVIGKKAPYPWWPEEALHKISQDLEKAMRTGAQKLEELYQTITGKHFWVEVTSTPLNRGSNAKYSLVVNWVDITERRQAEEALLRREKELKIKTKNLEEANTALRVLLEKTEEAKTDVEENILTSLAELVAPYIDKLKKSGLHEKQMTYLTTLESNLNEIVSPFARKLSSAYLGFTPSELQVANLVRLGKTNKEIAEILNLSVQTIETHRKNMRNKIGIRNKKANLRIHLLTV